MYKHLEKSISTTYIQYEKNFRKGDFRTGSPFIFLEHNHPQTTHYVNAFEVSPALDIHCKIKCDSLFSKIYLYLPLCQLKYT